MSIWSFSSKNHGRRRDFINGGTGARPVDQIRVRRDTTANREDCTPATGELFWDTDEDALYVGDGTTAGGILVSGTPDDKKVKVSSGDTTANFLFSKLVGGTGISIAKLNAGGDETVRISSTSGDVTGPGSSTDNALVRFDGTTGKLLQNGQITESDTGDLAGVASITGVRDTASYSAWADATAYVVGNKVVTSNPLGGTAKYECILNHTSDIDRDWPGYGSDWATYWEALDETLHLTGPVVIDDGCSLNRGQLRHVSAIRFSEPNGNNYIHLQTPALTANASYTLPVDQAGDVNLCLMIDTLNGSDATLYWGTPGLDAVAGSIGGNGQVLVSNGVDAITWEDRPFILRGFISGQPYDNQLVDSFTADRPMAFPAAFSGGYAKAKTASTGTATFTVKKNGSNVGTITFTASAPGTLALSGGMTLADGDVVDIYAPATSDATLADISWTLPGTLSYE